MNKIKFLYLLIVVLVLTNIGLVVFMYLHHPPHPMHGEGPKKEIAQKLEFSPEQVEKYEIIIKEHRSSIKEIESKIRTSKNNLYSLLKSDETDQKDDIINQLGELQKEIENAHFKHFEKLKALCTEKQLNNFNQLTEELGKLFAPPHPPKK